MGQGDRSRTSWAGWFRLIGLILLVFILSRLEIDKLVGILRGTDVCFLLAAILLNVPQIFIKACRWRALLKMQGISYSVKDAVLAYAGSTYIGFLTPGRVGDLVKVLHLRKDASVSVSRGLPSAIVDRLFDLYVLLVIGLLGLWRLGLLGKVSALAFPGLALAAAAPFLLFSRRVTEGLARILFRLAPGKTARWNLDARYEVFHASLMQLLGPRLLWVGLLTVAAYAIFILQCWCLVRGLRIESLGYVTVMAVMGITNLITMIPVSIAGLGTRDAILIFLFAHHGLGREMAVGFSLLIFFTFFVCGGLMGLACWLAKPVDVKTTPAS